NANHGFGTRGERPVSLSITDAASQMAVRTGLWVDQRVGPITASPWKLAALPSALVAFAMTPPTSLPSIQSQGRATSGPSWPPVANHTRPWTRWWWMGSAVDEPGLTAELEALRAAGMGGVEITPIYGVSGTEADFVPYLS